jgi:PTH1 family peptidyl-tRNA hydrolase
MKTSPNLLPSTIPEQQKSFLITGLGNPGRGYKKNRHNIGFMFVDRLAERLGVQFSRLQNKALVTDGRYKNNKIILAKPQTFMNLSGQAIRSLVKFYKLPLENLLVVHDDVDLPFDTIRLRPAGGSAGQKGMKSIIEHLSTQEFPRLRLGIGRPPGRMEAADYVLQDFSTTEDEFLGVFLDRAVDAALEFVTHGIQSAMTEFNRNLDESE